MNYVASVMMKEWEHSAVNLITHFRFVLRAHTPFTKSWEQAKDNEIDDDSAAYLNRANELIHNRSKQPNHVWNNLPNVTNSAPQSPSL